MGLYRRCKWYSQMVTCIVAISETDSVNINKTIYSMYINNINNGSDRRGSCMHSSSCVQAMLCLYRQTIYGRKEVSVVQQLKPGPDSPDGPWRRQHQAPEYQSCKTGNNPPKLKTLQHCTTSIHLQSLDKMNKLIQCNGNDIHLKCWYCWICGSGLKYGVRCCCQPLLSTSTVQSSSPTSCGMLTPVTVLFFTTPAISDTVFTLVFLKCCLMRLKHQSGATWCGLGSGSEGPDCELVHGPQGTIPEHTLVLVLATAVNTIQVHTCFLNSVVGEEMVHLVDDLAAAFAGWHASINQVVDLLWYSFTADTKQATLARSY
jgi:hypothetical protein